MDRSIEHNTYRLARRTAGKCGFEGLLPKLEAQLGDGGVRDGIGKAEKLEVQRTQGFVSELGAWVDEVPDEVGFTVAFPGACDFVRQLSLLCLMIWGGEGLAWVETVLELLNAVGPRVGNVTLLAVGSALLCLGSR